MTTKEKEILFRFQYAVWLPCTAYSRCSLSSEIRDSSAYLCYLLYVKFYRSTKWNGRNISPEKQFDFT